MFLLDHRWLDNKNDFQIDFVYDTRMYTVRLYSLMANWIRIIAFRIIQDKPIAQSNIYKHIMYVAISCGATFKQKIYF